MTYIRTQTTDSNKVILNSLHADNSAGEEQWVGLGFLQGGLQTGDVFLFFQWIPHHFAELAGFGEFVMCVWIQVKQEPLVGRNQPYRDSIDTGETGHIKLYDPKFRT